MPYFLTFLSYGIIALAIALYAVCFLMAAWVFLIWIIGWFWKEEFHE